jgi:hypothetical protein
VAEEEPGRLTRGQVLAAWAVGLVTAAVVTGVLAGVHDFRLYGTGARDGALVAMWTVLLGVVPALLVGLPTWFLLARGLRRQPRQWVHVAVYGLAGLVLATAAVAALFGRLLPQSGAADLLTLSGPWALGAAVGRLAVVPGVRRRRTRPTSDAGPRPRDQAGR